jgi:hypothetical protein
MNTKTVQIIIAIVCIIIIAIFLIPTINGMIHLWQVYGFLFF